MALGVDAGYQSCSRNVIMLKYHTALSYWLRIVSSKSFKILKLTLTTSDNSKKATVLARQRLFAFLDRVESFERQMSKDIKGHLNCQTITIHTVNSRKFRHSYSNQLKLFQFRQLIHEIICHSVFKYSGCLWPTWFKVTNFKEFLF